MMQFVVKNGLKKNQKLKVVMDRIKNQKVEYKWLNSVAGKVSIVVFVVAIILLIMAFSEWGNLDEIIANKINSFLLGCATTLLGIIITISFVQHFIDKQNIKEERTDEILMIKRHDKIIKILIEEYIIYYYCITTPIQQRTEDVPLFLKRDFSFKDMQDLYSPTLYLKDALLKPAVELFYSAEEKLREQMMQMLTSIDFKYNSELEKILIEFIEISLESDVRESIIGNTKITAGKKKASDLAVEMIKDENKDWVEKFKKGTIGGNIIVPYVGLYIMLGREAEVIEKYRKYVSEI